MAPLTRHPLMGSLERERRIPVVIESNRGNERRLAMAGVAPAAVRAAVELRAMHRPVTRRAGGRCLEGQGWEPASRFDQGGSPWIGRGGAKVVMAAGAGNRAVRAGQREPEGLVGLRAHRGGSKRGRRVTAEAPVRPGPQSGPGQTTPVGIHVTRRAAGSQAAEREPGPAKPRDIRGGRKPLPIGSVARPAVDLRMPPVEWQRRGLVLHPAEGARFPAGEAVASRAPGGRGSPGEGGSMRVGVAVVASRRQRTDDHSGRPPPRRAIRRAVAAVTGPAGRRLVSPLERIAGLLVPGQREGRRHKATLVMTGPAIHRLILNRGLPGVGIPMAGAARGGSRPAAGLAREIPMAASTWRDSVTTDQCERGPLVIEAGSADLLKAPGGVTGRAGRSEPPAVHVAMTPGAGFVGHRAVDRHRPPARVPPVDQARIEMALIAGHGSVASGEGVAGRVVAEAGGDSPGPGVVAGAAGISERSPMGVIMAGAASRFETGPPRLAVCRQGRRRGPPVRLGVALGALHLPVGLLQSPSGPLVVEAFRGAPGPLDQLELDPGVIRMTGRAGSATDAGAPVQPASSHREPPDVSMAGDASLRHPGPAPGMTAGALERPFEVPVGASQGARGDLGGKSVAWRGPRSQARQDERGPEQSCYHSQVMPVATTTPTWSSTATRAVTANGR